MSSTPGAPAVRVAQPVAPGDLEVGGDGDTRRPERRRLTVEPAYDVAHRPGHAEVEQARVPDGVGCHRQVVELVEHRRPARIALPEVGVDAAQARRPPGLHERSDPYGGRQ